MKSFSILVLLLFVQVISAQVSSIGGEDVNLPVITSPAPDAFAFAKYGNVPVSHHTGVPNISIPFYEITTNTGVNIPIGLSYHAGGIRVDEVADKTGLGWSLFAGGQINMRVNGKLDSSNEYLTAEQFSNLNLNGGTISPLYSYNADVYDYLYRVYKGEVDSYPDTFSFSFGGFSGEFFVDKNFNVQQIPASELKITTDQYLSQFTITDGKGNVYLFNWGSGNTKSPSGCSYTSLDDPIDSANHSYVLTKITTANNEVINFNYRTISYSYKSAVVETKFNVIYYSSTGCSSNSNRYCENIVNTEEKILTSISFPSGSLVFSYSDEPNLAINGTSRLDLPGAVALRKVVLKDKSSNEKWNYLLNYGYFSSGGTASEAYRLKLLEVVKNSTEKHAFLYYEDVLLPKRLSYSQDYWGFYNAKTSNSSLVPSVQYGGTTYPGGDRSIGALQYVRANTLKRVTYPTKGWTEFEYENNDYYSSGQSSQVTYDEQFSLSSTEFTGIIGSKIGYQNQSGSITDFKLTLYNDCQNNTGPSGLGQTYSIVRFYDKNNVLKGTYTASGAYNINPSTGDFSQMTLQMETSGDCDCTAIISWKRTVTQTVSQNVKSAGLRVSKITDHPQLGTPVVKTYTYNLPGSTQSSGTSSDDPLFYKIIYAPGNPDSEGYPNTNSKCTILVRQNSPFFALNNIKGQAVGYQSVQERTAGNGYVQYSYLTGGVSPITSRGWQVGHLSEKAVYNEAGSIQTKETFNYAYDNRFVSNSGNRLTTFPVADMIAYGVTTSFYELKWLGFTTYKPVLAYEINYLTTSWVQTPTSVTTEYYDNSQALVSTTTRTFNPVNLLAKDETTTNSRNETLTRRAYYPNDVTGSSSLPGGTLSSTALAATSSMMSKHQTSELVQLTEEANGKTSIQRRNFKDFQGSILPHTVQTSKDGSTLEDRLEYYNYSLNGNPIAVSRKDGPSIVYIWGYNRQGPIAKIENATYAEVDAALGGSYSPATIDETNMAQVETLRTSLTKAMVTTYTYDPLVGITSVTDPKGYTTTYVYDEFNRLKFVKDEEGNILSENQYKYKLSSN